MRQAAIFLNHSYSFSSFFSRAGIIWIIIGWISLVYVQAQPSQQFEVKAGEIASVVIPFQDRYRFPEFSEGNAIYTNGTSATVKLNYNLLLGEMQFIAPNGDTSVLANEYALKRVQIGKTQFYTDYRQGYFEVITNYPEIKLAIKQVLQQQSRENAGDNGYGVSVGPTTAVSSVRAPNTSQKIPTDIVLRKEIAYFVIDQNGRIYKANKATFLKLGTKNKKLILTYLEEQSIDFKKVDDLQKLVTFISQLSD